MDRMVKMAKMEKTVIMELTALLLIIVIALLL